MSAYCFSYKYDAYDQGPLYDIMGASLPWAKGTAEIIKFNLIVVVLMVCRHFLTFLRKTPLGMWIINFDDAITIHKYCARIIWYCMWIHVICHIVNIERQVDSDNAYIWAAMGKPQPTRADIYGSVTGWTGIVITILATIIYVFALDYPKSFACIKNSCLGKFLHNFNLFWYTHHLFLLCLGFIVTHPKPSTCWGSDCDNAGDKDHGNTWMWLICPVSIYFFERTYRFATSYSVYGTEGTKVLDASIKPGKVLALKLSKPKAWAAANFFRNPVKAGMYAFISCPSISQFEWHPFTLTSCPTDDFVEFHIRAAGDWTGELLKRYGDAKDYFDGFEEGFSMTRSESGKHEQESAKRGSPHWPEMRLQGPFGAPAQEYQHYDVVVLVGAGIGITPMASIIREMQNKAEKASCKGCGLVNKNMVINKHTYFHFVTREASAVTWFTDNLNQIIDLDHNHSKHHRLEVTHHITSAKPTNTAAITIGEFAHEHVVLEQHEEEVKKFKSLDADGNAKVTKEEWLAKYPGQEDVFKCYDTKNVGYVTIDDMHHDHLKIHILGNDKNLITNQSKDIHVEYGRPNWGKILGNIAHKHATSSIGIFFCGPGVLAHVINVSAKDVREKSGANMQFFQEHF